MHRRPFLRPGLVAALTLVAVTAQGLPAVADDGVVQVSGRLVQVLAEDVGDGGAIDSEIIDVGTVDTETIGTETDGHEASDGLISMVEVDGRLVALPEDITVDGATGDEVLLTIEGSGRARGADAVAATVDETSPATVVEIEVLPGEVAPASTQKTLTILPVYWTAPDATVDELKKLGQATAAYWSQQSNGSIVTAVQVKQWINANTSSVVGVPRSCSVDAMSALADQVMKANKYTLSASKHVAVYFPPWGSCNWAGLGSVGGSYSWINGYTNPEILAHEYGHNLGLGHANWYDCGSVALALPTTSCSSREYGDSVDVMGSGSLTGKPGNLNSAMADWLGLAKVVKAQAGKTTSATLYPLGSVSSVRAVSVPVSGGTVYVDFRPHVPPDTRKASWAGVQVHMQVMTSYYPTSYLLDMHPDKKWASPTLGAGESWQVPGTGLKITVKAVNGTSSANVTVAPVGGATVDPVPMGKGLGFVPMTPTRLLDTRTTNRPLGAGARRDVTVAGVSGVPSGAKAVALNVTAVGASATTFLRVWPAGQKMPGTSNLNTQPGQTFGAGVIAGVGGERKVSIFNNAGLVHVVVDVTGYFVEGSGSGLGLASQGVRVYDSRSDKQQPGRLVAGKPRTVQVAGVGGIPSNTTAVVANVSSVTPGGPGNITAYPASSGVPKTASVNHLVGDNVSNRTVVPLDSRGRLGLSLQGASADVVVDVVGWFGPSQSLRFTPIVPQRAVDTRTAAGGGALGAGKTKSFVLSTSSVPSNAAAVLVSVAATQQRAQTYLTVWGSGSRPAASDLNTGPGRDQANSTVVRSVVGGQKVYNDRGTSHVVVDVLGYFR